MIDEELAEMVQQIGQEMNTSSYDVIATAIKLLGKALNKKIIIKDYKPGADLIITALEDIKKPKNE